jgi:thiol-disulfide isomerase/thioredoxin
MSSRLMPITMLAILAVAIMWMTRTDDSPPHPLPIMNAEDILELRSEQKLLLLNFWASWCEPCEREIPALKALQEKWGPKGLRVLLVNLESPDRAPQTLEILDRFQASDLGVIKGSKEGFFGSLGIEAPAGLPYSTLFSAEKGPLSSWMGEKSFSELELEVKAHFE